MTKPFLAACLGFLAGGAYAADNGIYLGASVGQADVTVSAQSNLPEFDGEDTAFKIIAGLRPLNWLGFEVNYLDLGKPDDQGNSVDPTGVSGFAVGFAALGPIDLFAKAGAINWNADLHSSASDLVKKSDGTDFAWGLGAQFRVWSFSIRAEYERFEIEKGANLLSVGATWTFF
jgi:hypothetical protein